MLVTAARRNLYTDAFNEAVFERPGIYLTRALVYLDNQGIDGLVNGLAAGGRRQLRPAAPAADRLRPLVRPVHAHRRRARGRRLPRDPAGVVGVKDFPVPVHPDARCRWWARSVVACIPRAKAQLAKTVALGWSLVVLVLSVVMWIAFKVGGDRFQFHESYPWIPTWDARFTFAADGIALVMLMLIAVLVPVVILASWHDVDARAKRVGADLLRAAAGLRVHDDRRLRGRRRLPVLRVLRGHAGPDVLHHRLVRRRPPAVRRGEVLPLQPGRRPVHAGRGDRPVGGRRAHLRLRQARSTSVDAIDQNTARWLFLGFFVAFAIKAPFFPFHTWLPDAGGAAPAGAAALLVGVMDKVGTFGILRYCLPLFPEASRWFAPAALVLAVIGIIYAALLAVGQNDLKRLVSYTSIAHFGFIGIGIFAFTTQAGTGSVLYMVNHGLATGLLFIVVGMFVARRGSSAGQRLRRRRQAAAGAGRGAVLRRSGLAGAARHGAVRQRVPGADRHVHGAQGVRRDRHRRASSWPPPTCCGWCSAPPRARSTRPSTEVPAMRKDITLREKVVVAPLIAAAAAARLLPEAGHRCDQPGGPGDHAGRRHDRSGADGGRCQWKGGAEPWKT